MNEMRTVRIALESSNAYTDIADYGLLCVGWAFPEPAPKLTMLNVTGTDGALDLSDIYRGEIPLENVSATIRLFVLTPSLFDYGEFKRLYHGKRVKLLNSEDGGLYRVGRVWIAEKMENHRIYEVDMSMVADPYKYSPTEKTATVPAGAMNLDPSDFSLVSADQSDIALQTKVSETYGFMVRPYFQSGVGDGEYKVTTVEIGMTVQPNTDYRFTYSMTRPNDASIHTARLADGTPLEVVDTGISGRRVGSTLTQSKVFYIKFNSGDNTQMILRFRNRIYGASTSDPEGRNYAFRLYDIRLDSAAVSPIINDGRKLLTPVAVSDVDCTIYSPYGQRELTAGVPTTLFEVPLYNGANTLTAYSDTVGTVTLTYREGFL